MITIAWIDVNNQPEVWGKIDGKIYVKLNGTPIHEERFNHDNAYGFGEYCQNRSVKCKWQSPGCGSIIVYCEAENYEDVGKMMKALYDYPRERNCAFESGSGIVCKEIKT